MSKKPKIEYVKKINGVEQVKRTKSTQLGEILEKAGWVKKGSK